MPPVGEMPSHYHTTNQVAFANKSDSTNDYVALRSVARQNAWESDSLEGRTNSIGSNSKHQNLSPYFVLLFYIRTD